VKKDKKGRTSGFIKLLCTGEYQQDMLRVFDCAVFIVGLISQEIILKSLENFTLQKKLPRDFSKQHNNINI
jgi:hypothetical protein